MKILRIQSVISITGLPRSTIYAYIKKGLFPKSIKLGERSVGWLEEDIESWIKSKIIN